MNGWATSWWRWLIHRMTRRPGGLISDEVEHFGPLTVRPMTRAEIARHSLQAEFMRDAEPGEWHELPGGTEEGSRMPDMEWDNGTTFTGCWFSQPLNDGTE